MEKLTNPHGDWIPQVCLYLTDSKRVDFFLSLLKSHTFSFGVQSSELNRFESQSLEESVIKNHAPHHFRSRTFFNPRETPFYLPLTYEKIKRLDVCVIDPNQAEKETFL